MSAPVAVPRERSTANPRTAELPMAFTAWEFWRGVIATYVAFLVLTVMVSVWWLIYGAIVAVTFAAPIAFVTTIIAGAPLSLVAGVLLRREPWHGAHYVAHAGAGAVAGAVGLTLYLTVTTDIWSWSAPHVPDFQDVATFPWLLVYPLLTPVSAMWGWRFTSKRALSGR